MNFPGYRTIREIQWRRENGWYYLNQEDIYVQMNPYQKELTQFRRGTPLEPLLALRLEHTAMGGAVYIKDENPKTRR